MAEVTSKGNLFRTEALRYKAARLSSAPLVVESRVMIVLTVIFSVLLCLAVFLLITTRYEDVQFARGILEPKGGTQKIIAPLDATVKEIMVGEGDLVVKGQIVALLSTSLFDYAGRLAYEAEISKLLNDQETLYLQLELQSKLHQQSLLQISQSTKNLQIDRGLVASELTVIDQQLNTSERNRDSLVRLLQNDSASQVEFDQFQSIHLNMLREHWSINQRVQEIDSRLEDVGLSRNRKDLEFQTTKLQLHKLLADIEYRIDQLKNQELITLLADHSGEVAALAITPGQSVRHNQLLMYINPSDSILQAIVYVPSSASGTLMPGQELLISYDAFDVAEYGRYRAAISTVSSTSMDPRELLLPVPGISEPVYRVVIELEQRYVEGGDIFLLQAGMLLTANIVRSEMSLMAHILKPMLRLRDKIG